MDFVRRLQRREILRTATRDLLGRDTVEATAAQLSTLADVVVADAFRCADGRSQGDGRPGAARQSLAVFATGDLGLRELGYTGNIDLLFVRDEAASPADTEAVERVARDTLEALATCTDESYQPRLERRLRGWAGATGVSVTVAEYRAAGAEGADLASIWSILTQSRFIAGAPTLGARVLEWARGVASRGRGARG